MSKGDRRKGIIHNCLKDLDFELVEAPIFKQQRAIIKCKTCGAMYKETDWEVGE